MYVCKYVYPKPTCMECLCARCCAECKNQGQFSKLGYTKKKFFFGHGNSHQPPEKMWVTSKPLGFASDSLDSVKVSPVWGVQNVGNFVVYVLQSNTERQLVL